VCSNWYDYVWAYFRVMVDVLTEQVSCRPELARVHSMWWALVIAILKRILGVYRVCVMSGFINSCICTH